MYVPTRIPRPEEEEFGTVQIQYDPLLLPRSISSCLKNMK